MSSNPVGSTHAHPASSPTPPGTPPESSDPSQDQLSVSFNNLFGNGLHLKGLQGADRTSKYDVYCPDVRRSSFSNDPVSQQDMVSCWKGLGIKQAEEILTWERIFRQAIEAQVLGHVQKLVAMLPPTIDDVFKLTSHVGMPLENLVRTMIDMYFACTPPAARVRKWSMSKGDLPSFVYNFLRTRDCFLDVSRRLCVRLDLTFSLSSSSIIGEVNWQPPAIDFGNLPATLSPRESYSIFPVYNPPHYGNSCKFAVFPDSIDYKVGTESSSLPLNCTRETKITATTTMDFPEGVRYERTTRYIVQIPVAISCTLKQGDSIIGLDCSPSEQQKWKKDSRSRAMIDEQDEVTECDGSTPYAKGRSVKRKADEQVPDRLKFEAKSFPGVTSMFSSDHGNNLVGDVHRKLIKKRQRRPWHDFLIDGKGKGKRIDEYVDSLRHLSTTCVGEAATLETHKSSCTPSLPTSKRLHLNPKSSKSRAYTTKTKISRVTPALRKQGSVKPIMFKRDGGAPWSDSPMEDCDEHVDGPNATGDGACDSRDDRARRLDSPMDGCENELDGVRAAWNRGRDPRDDQETIRRNYSEFFREASRSQKESVDMEEETEEFERIFLEGSSSGASSASEAMSGMSEGLSTMSLCDE